MTAKKRNYEKIITALIEEPTKTKACEAVGIDRSTLARYEKDSEFIKLYRTAIHDMMEKTTRKLQSETYKAVTYLAELRDNPDAPITERRQACKHILELTPRYTEQNDILARIEALERNYDNEESI